MKNYYLRYFLSNPRYIFLNSGAKILIPVADSLYLLFQIKSKCSLFIKSRNPKSLMWFWDDGCLSLF